VFSRTRPKEWRKLKYLTDRIDDDDGEKWATVSSYGLLIYQIFLVIWCDLFVFFKALKIPFRVVDVRKLVNVCPFVLIGFYRNGHTIGAL
jgi:hypothetical protein